MSNLGIEPKKEYIPTSNVISSRCCLRVILCIRIFQKGIVNQKPIKQLVKFALKPQTGINKLTILTADRVSYPDTKNATYITIR